MEYHIISKKQLFYILVFSCIALIITFIYQKTSLDQIYTCQGAAQMTIIIKKNNRFYLSPAGSSREVLDCLGKSLPIYERTFEIVAATTVSEVVREELSDRYNIDLDYHDDDKFESEYFVVDDYTFVGDGDALIGVKKKAINNPFEFEEMVNLYHPKKIIAPKIADHILKLLQKGQVLDRIELVQMSDGDFYKAPLL